MIIEQYKLALLALLHKHVITRPQLKKLMTQVTISGAKPAAPPWYVALWRISIESIAIVVFGTALGLVFVVIAHYTGIEAWVEFTRSK